MLCVTTNRSLLVFHVLLVAGPSSPDIVDPLMPPIEPSTSGDSSCSSDISANDVNLNGINDNNADQEFPHELLNGHIEPNPSLLPQQPVDNHRLQWISSTTWQIQNPVHPSLPTPNVLSLQQPLAPILSSSIIQSNLGSPPPGLLGMSLQNGTVNHAPIPVGHHTVGLSTANHKIRVPKQSRLTAPLPPSNDIPFSQIKRGRKLGQVQLSEVCTCDINTCTVCRDTSVMCTKAKWLLGKLHGWYVGSAACSCDDCWSLYFNKTVHICCHPLVGSH